jgi:hypothetical protein
MDLKLFNGTFRNVQLVNLLVYRLGYGVEDWKTESCFLTTVIYSFSFHIVEIASGLHPAPTHCALKIKLLELKAHNSHRFSVEVKRVRKCASIFPYVFNLSCIIKQKGNFICTVYLKSDTLELVL